jgi:seryl-tRNA synthetase
LPNIFAWFLPPELKARFDYKAIRDQADLMKQNVALRNAGGNVSVDKVVSLYEAWTAKKQEGDQVRTRRNEIASTMSKSKSRDPDLIAEGKRLKDSIATIEEETDRLESEMTAEAFKLPNWTHPSAPRLGEAPAIVSMVGSKPTFDGFTPKTHMELGKSDDLLHFPTAFGASKFYYGKRDAALLETALVNWAMTTVANKHGFTALTTPDVIAVPFAEACGFQPRSAATQMYSIANSELCLVGTQEIPMASLFADAIIPEVQLPIKMVAYGHCFRHETGSSSESRGLYRVHQFTKVEMFIICKPEDSDKYHQELLEIEVGLLKDLQLHFKVLDMPTDDLGASAYRKFDIEAWMPYRDDYGEVCLALHVFLFEGLLTP